MVTSEGRWAAACTVRQLFRFLIPGGRTPSRSVATFNDPRTVPRGRGPGLLYTLSLQLTQHVRFAAQANEAAAGPPPGVSCQCQPPSQNHAMPRKHWCLRDRGIEPGRRRELAWSLLFKFQRGHPGDTGRTLSACEPGARVSPTGSLRLTGARCQWATVTGGHGGH